MYVAILTNRDYQTPDDLGLRVAALAIGRPIREAVAVTVAPADLDALAGVYQINEKETYVVRGDGARVLIQRNGGRLNEVFPLSPNEFFYDKNTLDRLTFTRDAAGKVSGLKVSLRFGPPTAAARTDKPLPSERAEIKLGEGVLERYVGVYEIAPTFSINITRSGQQLFGEPTGQTKLELFAESEKKFFLKAVDAEVEFQTDAEGKVTGLILRQGGRDTPAKKVK